VTDTATKERTVPRLKARYRETLRDQLKGELGLSNVMQVPRLDKVVINMGVGAATAQASLLEGAVRDLTTIAGQKPVITRAKRSIAGFKLREGNAIGTTAGSDDQGRALLLAMGFPFKREGQ
jgi:large subunit ribosomal protein L5